MKQAQRLFIILLLLAIFRFTKDFSKDYKYTVGECIKKETMEMLTLCEKIREIGNKGFQPLKRR